MMTMSGPRRMTTTNLCRRLRLERMAPAQSTAQTYPFSTHRSSTMRGALSATAIPNVWVGDSSTTTASPTNFYSLNPHQFPVNPHNRLQFRYFDHRKKRKAHKKKVNPFKVLNIPEGVVLYKDAKKKFLQIAMKNHPDTISGDVADEERDAMRDKFIKARMAFETLAEDPNDGTAILAEDLDEAVENFDSWFKSETGFNTPFHFDMDPATMKEVASMTEKIGGGLDRDGGMWALARMVTASVKSGSDAGTPLRLESGDVKDRVVNGSLRRRRKR